MVIPVAAIGEHLHTTSEVCFLSPLRLLLAPYDTIQAILAETPVTPYRDHPRLVKPGGLP